VRLNPDRIRKSVALSAVSLRPGTLADTRQIVDLNLESVAVTSPYENGNFQWFAERLRRFIYIDRVVVSSGCRNQGIGSALYAHALSWAKQAGLLSLVAEMDLDPPNIGSLNFHKNKGFVQLGTRVLDSAKTVSMQARSV
jgi:predicted GNAT superfamily acetyltransferase